MSEQPKFNKSKVLDPMAKLVIDQAEKVAESRNKELADLHKAAQAEFRAAVREIATTMGIPEDAPVRLSTGDKDKPLTIEWHDPKAKKTRAKKPAPQQTPPKKRGRPKKKPSAAADPAPKRKRGRPRKNPAPATAAA